MQRLLQDLRYSFRRLRKTPGLALIAISSLGLGIGVNSAIFSLVNTILWRPLPMGPPDQPVTAYGTLSKGTEATICVLIGE